jgi:hypothetical protein
MRTGRRERPAVCQSRLALLRKRRTECEKAITAVLTEKVKAFEAEFPGCRVSEVGFVNKPHTRVALRVQVDV